MNAAIIRSAVAGDVRMNSLDKHEFSASVRHTGSVREVMFNKLQPDGSYGTFCTYDAYWLPEIIDALEKKRREAKSAPRYDTMTFVGTAVEGVFACVLAHSRLVMFCGNGRSWRFIAEFDVAQLPGIIRELKRCVM